jgi:hypothetical protein
MTETLAIVPEEAKGKPLKLSAKKIAEKYGSGEPVKHGKPRPKAAAKAAPGEAEGEGDGWRDVEPPAKRKAAAKADPAEMYAAEIAKNKAAQKKAKAPKAKTPAKPKAKAAPKTPAKPKAAAKAKPVKAEPKPKITRTRTITKRTAFLIRLTDAEIAKLDKSRDKGESRPGAILRHTLAAVGVKPGK